MKYLFLTFFLCFLISGNFLKAQNLEKVRKLEAELAKVEGEEKVKVFNKLCWAYRSSDFGKSIEYGKKGLALAKEIDYKEGETEAINMMGVVRRNEGNYPEAFDLYTQALKLAKEHNFTQQMGYAYNNLGEIYKFLGDYPNATENTKKAIETFEELNDSRGVSYGYIRLGEIYELEQQYASALDAFYTSLRIRKNLDDEGMLESSYNRIGNVYNNLGEYQSAIKFLTLALEISKRLNDTKSIAENLSDLAFTYQKQGKNEKSIEYAQKGFALAQENGIKPVARNASRVLAQVYPLIGNFEEAYKYQQIFIQYQDSLLNDNERKSIQSLEIRNAIEKKEVEKQQLAREQEILRQADQKVIERQQWLIGLVILGLVLLAILIGVLIFSNRQKQKANQVLNEQKGEILLQKDVIEAKNKEIARINESRIKQIIDNAFDAIITLDDKGLVTSWSQRASVLFGWEEKEVLGLSFTEIVFDTSNREAFMEIWEKQKAYKSNDRTIPVPQELKSQNKYGSDFPIELIINKLALKSEIFFTIFIRDITDVKKAYEALIQSQKETVDALETNKKLILEQNELLERKVEKRTEQIEEARQEIEKKNEDITASIVYASRIQKAILPPEEEINSYLKDYFVWWQPRDLVGGDFYWFTNLNEDKADDSFLIAAVDCTGHGVPGALMSMLGMDALNHIVLHHRITEPSQILEALHQEIRKVLKQSATGNNDGMDMTLVLVDKVNNQLYFSGAKNPLIYIQNNELKVIKGSKFPIGGQILHRDREFKTHIIDLNVPTLVYLFSDGFQDQFGGKQGRKFMIKRLRELLFEIHQLPMEEQKLHILRAYEKWVGKKHKQIDDILLIGLNLG